MRKIITLTAVVAALLVLTNCGSSKKAAKASVPAKLTYETNMTAVVTTNCAPCHIPSKGGNKKPYDNFANVKSDIDEIIRRIELNPTDRGFMPFKRPKLSDSTIAVFKKWKEDGLLEK